MEVDDGKSTRNTRILPVHDDGIPIDDCGRLGVALKVKMSATQLKMGERAPTLPVLRSDDGRLLPQIFRGAQVTSQEVAGFTFYGGQFRATSPRNDVSMEKYSRLGAPGAMSERFNFGGTE